MGMKLTMEKHSDYDDRKTQILTVILALVFPSYVSVFMFTFDFEPKHAPSHVFGYFRVLCGFHLNLASTLVCLTFLLRPHLHNPYLSCIM